MLTYGQKERMGFCHVLDSIACSSPYGTERAREPHFYTPSERDALLAQLDTVQTLLIHLDDAKDALSRLSRLMMGMKDVRRAVRRIEEAPLSEPELFEIKRFLLQLELMEQPFKSLCDISGLTGIPVKGVKGALDILDSAGQRAATFFIPDDYSKALLSARKDKRAAEELIRRAELQERPALMAKRQEAAVREDAEERRIRQEITAKLQPYVNAMLSAAEAVGELDFAVARAEYAKRIGGVKPGILDSGIKGEDMVNPLVCDALAVKDRHFTPVSMELPKGATVITGANMGGKSVAIRTVALCALMTQCGIFPAAKRFETVLFDDICMIAEDTGTMESGLSSFGSEITRLVDMLSGMQASRSANGMTLVLLDEFARGTNPYEGAAIAKAVTKKLGSMETVSLIATHFDGVADAAQARYQVKGLMDMDVEEVRREIAASKGDRAAVIAKRMDYGLVRINDKRSCPRDALNICRLLGLDEEILNEIERAY